MFQCFITALVSINVNLHLEKEFEYLIFDIILDGVLEEVLELLRIMIIWISRVFMFFFPTKREVQLRPDYRSIHIHPIIITSIQL